MVGIHDLFPSGYDPPLLTGRKLKKHINNLSPISPLSLGCTLHQHGHTHGGGGGGGGGEDGHQHNSHGGHSHDDHQSERKPASNPDQPQRSRLLNQSAGGGYGSLAVKGDRPTAEAALARKKKAKHKSSNINVKAAFVHVVGDFCQSVGVLVAAIIIYFKVSEGEG